MQCVYFLVFFSQKSDVFDFLPKHKSDYFRSTQFTQIDAKNQIDTMTSEDWTTVLGAELGRGTHAVVYAVRDGKIAVTEYGFNMYVVMLQQLYNWQIDWDFMLVYLPSARIRLCDIKPAVSFELMPLRSCYSLIEGWLFSPVVRDMHRLHHNRPCLDTLTQLTPWLLRVHTQAARRLFEPARQALLARLHDADLVEHVLNVLESQLIDAIARRCCPSLKSR
jgi:hypothetical protein